MKKYLFAIIPCVIVLACMLLVSCSCSGSDSKSEDASDTTATITEPQPLNISVYLDLSDRLTRDLTPSQMERDTAIINHLIDLFIEDCRVNGRIIDSKNHFQVFFYPAPNITQVAVLAKGLNVDLEKTDLKNKKVELRSMKKRFQDNLTQIYQNAITQKEWVGCDIWGFFSNKNVDQLCIRKGYRNILVILTDGYLFHSNNKIVEEKAYSYVLPQTLAVPGSSLIVKRKGLTDLEVLMLEVNPYTPQQHDALISVLENWFKGMDVKNFVVSETDLPINTEVYIDSFVKQ